MMNRFYKTIWLVLVAAFLVAGCEREYRQKELAYGPDPETLVVPADYAAQAIEATGGMKSWTETKGLELDCVVSFDQPDGSFYLTEHHYEIYPWSNSIRISAREPQGKFVWQLSQGQLSVLEGGEPDDALPIAMDSRRFADVILNAVTAPVRFLDTSSRYAKRTKPVTVGGSVYEQFEQFTIAEEKPQEIEVEPCWSKAVFYQNKTSSLVDILWFVKVDENKLYVVRGYDYSEVEKGAVSIPTRIEIFRANMQGASSKRLAKIVFK